MHSPEQNPHHFREPTVTLGYEVTGTKAPVEIERRVLGGGHMHVRGRTRSGKTSLAILPLVQQLIQPYPTRASSWQHDPIFVFDLGGDLTLFNHVQDLAKQLGRQFRFLSLDPLDDWHFFDPLQAIGHGERNVVRLANMLIEAFNLDHGLIYGGQYFTQQNLAALLRVARQLNKESDRTPTLEDVAAYLDNPANRREMKDAEQIRLAFNFLLEYPQLKPELAPDAARRIDMRVAIEGNEVVYFFTPTLNEATTARQIAGLGLYSLVNAAIQMGREGKRPRKIWVFVDEFQELAGRSFAALLAQSGKHGISLVMANQTTSQLESRDTSLAQVVADNTHVKQYFTVTTMEDIEALQTLSNQVERPLGGSSTRGLASTITVRDVLMPKLDHNEVLQVSATFGQSFLVVDDGRGHKEPQRVFREHTLDPQTWEKYRSTPLPQRAAPLNKPEPVARRRKPPVAAGRPATVQMQTTPTRQEHLAKLVSAKRAVEGLESGP